MNNTINYSTEVIRLLITKPTLYEFEIFITMLKEEIEKYSNDYLDIEYNVCLRKNMHITNRNDLSTTFGIKLDSMLSFSASLSTIINIVFKKYYGEPGVPSDIKGLYYVSSTFGRLYKSTIDWIIDIRSYTFDKQYECLASIMENIGIDVITSIHKVVHDYEIFYLQTLDKVNSGQKGTFSFDIQFNINNDLIKSFNEEIERLSQTEL